MGSNTIGDCRKCLRFQPHDTFEFFGLCTHTNELKIKYPAKSNCEAFKEISLEGRLRVLSLRGWLRCRSCNRVLFTVEELREHLDDEIGGEVFSDIVASEEAPAAS
jgi:hypothetical protein